MANEDDTGYDPREFELVGGKRAPRPSAEFMADPDVQAQMKFNDFINSPEGMKLLREMHEKALAAEAEVPGVKLARDQNPQRNLRNKTEDVSRRVMADEQAKLAPQYSKPLATDTE